MSSILDLDIEAREEMRDLSWSIQGLKCISQGKVINLILCFGSEKGEVR